MGRKTAKNKTFFWITEEWLVLIIAILLLLAIAIGAAGARTFIQSKTTLTPLSSSSSYGEELE